MRAFTSTAPIPRIETPWGLADFTEPICEGVMWVSTPGHGGIGVHQSTAINRLSDAARKHGEFSRGYYWFEEDAAWAIAAYEIREYMDQIRDRYKPKDEKYPPTAEAMVLETLSAWYGDYLTERGIEPDPKAFTFWLAWQDDKARRARRDPDTIVSAIRHADEPSITVVTTADGARHLVEAASYDWQRSPNLLSACRTVDGVI